MCFLLRKYQSMGSMVKLAPEVAPKGTFGLNQSLQYFDEFRSVKKNFRPRKCLFAPKILALALRLVDLHYCSANYPRLLYRW